MGLAVIIEDEKAICTQLETTIKEIDGRLEIIKFNNLEGFYDWFVKIINAKGTDETSATTPNSLAKPPLSPDLKLIVGDITFLGPRYFTLIEKVRRLMARRNIISNENDLSIILTAYESPTLNYKQIEQRIITNVIFKPFDIPILKQHLQIALANHKAVTDFVVFNQKVKAVAEMLKEVQLETFSEMGFTTRSFRPLDINSISKYYGSHFESPGLLSVMAICTSCGPHPEFKDQFSAEFRYIGLGNAQIKKMRLSLYALEQDHLKKFSLTKKTIEKFNKKGPGGEVKNFLLFGDTNNYHYGDLKGFLEDGLSNIRVFSEKNMSAFMEGLKKGAVDVLGERPIHGLFIGIDQFSIESGLVTWTRIQEQIEVANKRFHAQRPVKPQIFILSHRAVSEAHLREWHQCISDIIYFPVDITYLKKRMATHFPEMKPLDNPIEVLGFATDDVIRVANPIEIASISEACLTMKYYRPISFHGFRRFHLPTLHGEEVHEMLASCYFSEKLDKDYINHFVFFGITDKSLKYIRRWILEKYIESKDPAA